MNSKIFNNIKYLLQKISFLVISDMLQLILTFLMKFYFLTLISDVVFGKYNYYLNFFSIISIFIASGVNRAIIRDVSNKKYGSYFKGLKYKYVMCFITGLILLAFSMYFFKFNKEIFHVLIVFIIFLFPVSIFDVAISAMNGLKNYKKIAFIDFSRVFFINLIFILILVFYSDYNFLILIIFYFIVNSIINMISHNSVRKKMINNEISEDILEYSIKITSLNFIINLGALSDKVILGYFSDFYNVALLSYVFILNGFVKGIYNRFGQIMIPLIHNFKNMEENWLAYRKKILYLYLSSFLFALISIYIFPFFFKYLLPEKFLKIQSYFIFLSFFTIAFCSGNTVLHEMIKSHSNSRIMFSYYSIISFLRISLIIILVKKYDIWAIVYTTSFLYFLGSILSYSIIRISIKKEKYSIRN